MKKILLPKHKRLVLNHNFNDKGIIDHQYKIVSNAVGIATKPSKTDYLSNLQNETSYVKLQNLQERMLSSRSGAEILNKQPRILKSTIDQTNLKYLPKNTFGYQFYERMEKENFNIDDRYVVTSVPDLRQAYVLQRFIEIHDFHHVLLNLESTVEDELLVKMQEFQQTKLPACAMASIFGWVPFGLHSMNDSSNIQQIREMIPKVLHVGRQSRFTLKVFYEQQLDKDIDDVRRELRIVKLK